MMERKGDPFFEQLKADIQEGIDEADRGELVDLDVVLAEMDEVIEEVERRKRARDRR